MDMNASICNVCQKGATLFCSCESPVVFLCETCVSSHMTKRKGLPHEIYGLESYYFYAVPGYKDALSRRMQSSGPKEIKEILSEIDWLKGEVAKVTETMIAKVNEHGQTVVRELEELKAAVEADIRAGEEEMKAAIYLLSAQLHSPIAKVLWQASEHKPVLMTCRSNVQDWVTACEALLFSAIINLQIELSDYQPPFALSQVAQLKPSQKVCVYYSPQDVLLCEGQRNLVQKPLFPNSADLTPVAKRGPIQLESGEYYLGEWNSASQMHGYGKWFSAQGQVYEGQWKCGLRQGQGLEISAIGEVYEGSWQDNEKSGVGSVVDRCGSEYWGSFVRGHKEKFGCIRYGSSNAALCYMGEFANDKFAGLGCLWWRNGAQYSGNFENGVKLGLGVMRWAEGDIYSGEFAEDRMQGSGHYYWENGCSYEGEWLGGRKSGQGKMLTSGTSYDGGWMDDAKYGAGIECNARGKQKRVSYPARQPSAQDTSGSHQSTS